MNEFLLLFILILLVVILVIILRRKELKPQDFSYIFSDAISRTNLSEKIGSLETLTSDLRNSYRELEMKLRIPSIRGSMAEIMLENILTDQLPPDMFSMRKSISNGKIPDAQIFSTAGIICIDSKFPLENYLEFCKAENDQKDSFKKTFLRDITRHLDKIQKDYIHPEIGTSDFAFAYIQSEGVY